VRISPLLSLCALLTLTGCSDTWFGKREDPPLPGERLSVMQLQNKLEVDPGTAAAPFNAPNMWENDRWPQAGGYPTHVMGHVALSDAPLKKTWSVDIGSGSHARNPLTAQPVVLDDTIYTLDTSGQVSAFDTHKGKRLWSRDIGAKDEDDSVLGGGLAADADKLYATNGYTEVLALQANDGGIAWRTKLPTPVRAAPTILDGQLYVITLDNRLFALDTATGEIRWDYRGVAEGAGLLGAAAAAANRDIVLVPFSTGEVLALRVANGSMLWADNLAPVLRLGGAKALADMRALPVIDREMALAMSYGGRLASIDLRSGSRIWQRDIGGRETPVIAGDYVFVLDADNQLFAIGRRDGAIRWMRGLEQYRNPKDRTRAIVWTGPLYAGGRLIMAGSDGRTLDIDPATGNILREWNVGDTPAVPLVVAKGTLYILTGDGILSAWR
jgi:outer membrane protein assembly factor BamB